MLTLLVALRAQHPPAAVCPYAAGFRFAVAAVARGDGAVRAWLPARTTYAWAPWEEPLWRERLKPVYAALRDVWGNW